ncbi:MAG: SurA N-terminal domain-containing protein [Gammaproteobacteria bacterium]|nr:SurA N-terminal domain-containing protein [Gammaproteobacteria bacterium]
MLQFIRDNATGWIAWGIVILISIPFALWGIHQYVTPDSSVAVATVDDTEIGYYDFQRLYARRRQQLQSILGAGLVDAEEDNRLRREVLDGMIDSEVLVRSGIAAGMRVGDEQLANTIQTQEVFQSTGGFSQDVYEGWLRSQGYSSGGFEEELRRSLLEQQIALGIAGSDFISGGRLRDAVRLRLQTRTFSLLTIPASDFRVPEPTGSEVRAHFDRHRSAYTAPERVRLRYLEISLDEIAAGIKADNEELRALFDAEPERFVTPEKREVSHILLAVPSDAGADEVAQTKERLATLKGRILAGESFEDLARENSDDPGSAASGGALGFIERGMMVPEFEEAVFALAPTEVSDPVRTSFGWHLVKVMSVQEPRDATFEEVRGQVLEQYQAREAERIYVERVETLANVTYEHPESLEAGARELGLAIRETGPVTRDGQSDDPIASRPAVVAAAFSSDVLDDGNNSDPIEFEPGRIVVVRAFDHEPPRELDLDEARAEIVAALQSNARRRAATERGRALLSDLRNGRDSDAVAADAGVEWSRFENVSRIGGELAEKLLDVAFRMPRPGTAGAQFDGLLDDGGDFVIVSLSRVDDGEITSLGDDETRRLRQVLETDIGRTMFDGFVRGRRQSADIRIVEQNLES